MAAFEAPELPRDLGDGLVLRRATAADAAAIVAFNRRTHSWSPSMPLRETFADWTRDLLDGGHPTTGPGNFTVVEETGTGAIVSTLGLIAQTWSYSGIPITVGRPELVGTDPAYRRRGLVRAQMEVVHGWAAARGMLVQGITGIPWYYRQFGYEMTLALDGGRIGYAAQIPELATGAEEPYLLRPATEADLSFLMRTYEAGIRHHAVAALRDEAQWRYELAGRRPGSLQTRAMCVITDREGDAVGLLFHWPRLFEGEQFVVEAYELRPGVPWTAVTPSVLRYLRKTAESYAAQAGPGATRGFASYVFLLGTQHPAYLATPHWLPQERKPYAWYLRVPDLPRFIRAVAPVLERRLAGSALQGYSGERQISFYRDGLRLAFGRGRLTVAEAWQPTVEQEGHCAFPGLTFLHLLFGHRSLAEVGHLFADCWADDESAALLNALFPPGPADVWGLA
jgi:hypothetical protein